MFRHSIERGNEFMTTFARFDFLDFRSEFLLNTLAKSHVVGVDDISHEVDALGDRIDALIALDLEAYVLQHLVDGITDDPKLCLGLGEHQSIVTIAEEMPHAHAVLQRMVEVYGQYQVAGGLRWTKSEADALGQQLYEVAQNVEQGLVLEDVCVCVLGKLVVHVVVEVDDVELIGVSQMRIVVEGFTDLAHQVVRAPAHDACARGAYEASVQVPVNDTHDGVAPDAPLHGNNLQSAMLAILIDIALTVFGHRECTIGYFTLKVGDNFLSMCQQLFSFTALLTDGAPKNLVEGVGHIAIFDDFLYYVAFSAHSLP